MKNQRSWLALATFNWQLATLILLVTLLNAAKPIYIDDAWQVYPATQLLHHPLDPYGYVGFWYQWPEPANWLYTPPVWPYWMAGVMKLFGSAVLLWKLAVLPWIGLLVFSLHRLFGRFAPELAVPLTAFAVLSPAVLPGINLMLDLPADAMGLAGLCVAMSAIDRRSLRRAAVAGVLLALAMQIKYTAAVMPAVAAVYGLLRRRVAVSLLPGFVAAILFAAWELYIARRYGWSHFLFHLGWNDILKGSLPKSALVLPLVTQMGGVAPALGLLAMAALGASPLVLLAGGAAVVLGYALLFDAAVATRVFCVFGAVVWAAVGISVYRLWRGAGLADRFLCAWFGLQLGAYFAVSPFPATRRVTDLFLVMTLVVGRVAARRMGGLAERRRRWAWEIGCILVGGMLLGLGFEALDINEARTQKQGVLMAAAIVKAQRRAGQAVWFTGHWALQFYGERLGFHPVIPDHSLLRRGDWLIASQIGFSTQHIDAPPLQSAVAQVVISDPVPLSTLIYYSGSLPLQHWPGPRVVLTIYQIQRDYVPVTTYEPDLLVRWAATRGRPLPVDAIAAVMRAVSEAGGRHPAQARAARAAVERSGTPALLAALEDPDPGARRWAAATLGQHLGDAGDLSAARAALGSHAKSDPDPAVREAARIALEHLAAAGRSRH